MTGTPIIKKVPGNLVKFDQEKDGYVDLKKLSKTELLDLDQRERNLLKNKKFIGKLPDKGQKILTFFERIQCELKKRDELEKLSGLLASLNVNETKDYIDQLEWVGKSNLENTSDKIIEEDEKDPLKILATHSGSSRSKKKPTQQEGPEAPIQTLDVQDKSNFYFDNVDHYAKELCHRFDAGKNKETKNRFYTHKSLKVTSVRELIKDKEPKIVPSNSFNTSSNKTKILSLQESIIVQQQQMKHLKEVEMRRAMDKLMNKTKFSIGFPETDLSEYRGQTIDSDDEASSPSTNECDYDDDERDSVVFYNLID